MKQSNALLINSLVAIGELGGIVYRNIYEGPKSCYALKEGIYVPGKGVNAETAIGILYLILRDLKRGWTYNHSCQRIPMTPTLFVRRATYLIALCHKHTRDPVECRYVDKLVHYVLKHKRLPPEALRKLRIAEAGKPVYTPVQATRPRRRRTHYARAIYSAW